MFYCDSCADKKGYPKTLFRSFGLCELCHQEASCSDLSCRKLRELTEVSS